MTEKRSDFVYLQKWMTDLDHRYSTHHGYETNPSEQITAVQTAWSTAGFAHLDQNNSVVLWMLTVVLLRSKIAFYHDFF